MSSRGISRPPTQPHISVATVHIDLRVNATCDVHYSNNIALVNQMCLVYIELMAWAMVVDEVVRGGRAENVSNLHESHHMRHVTAAYAARRQSLVTNFALGRAILRQNHPVVGCYVNVLDCRWNAIPEGVLVGSIQLKWLFEMSCAKSTNAICKL